MHSVGFCGFERSPARAGPVRDERRRCIHLSYQSPASAARFSRHNRSAMLTVYLIDGPGCRRPSWRPCRGKPDRLRAAAGCGPTHRQRDVLALLARLRASTGSQPAAGRVGDDIRSRPERGLLFITRNGFACTALARAARMGAALVRLIGDPPRLCEP